MPNVNRGNCFSTDEYRRFDSPGKESGFQFLKETGQWTVHSQKETFTDDGVLLDEEGKERRIEVECVRPYRLAHILRAGTTHCSIKSTNTDVWLKHIKKGDDELMLVAETSLVVKSPKTSFMTTNDAREGKSRFYDVANTTFVPWKRTCGGAWNIISWNDVTSLNKTWDPPRKRRRGARINNGGVVAFFAKRQCVST